MDNERTAEHEAIVRAWVSSLVEVTDAGWTVVLLHRMGPAADPGVMDEAVRILDERLNASSLMARLVPKETT